MHDDDDDDEEEGEDDDENEDDDPLPAGNLLLGGAGGAREGLNLGLPGGANLKVSEFPTVLTCLFLAKTRETSASTS